MRKIHIPVTVPGTEQALEESLTQSMSHYVMSRTEYNGAPIRRERALIHNNPTLDQVWAEIQARRGRRVTITALLHGWPVRVSRIEFTVPRTEVVFGPTVIEQRVSRDPIVPTPDPAPGEGGWHPTIQYTWEFLHVQASAPTRYVKFQSDFSGSVVFVVLHGSTRVRMQVRDPRRGTRRGQVSINCELARMQMNRFVTGILEFEGSLGSSQDTDPLAGIRAGIRGRFKLPHGVDISIFCGMRDGNAAIITRFRWEPTLAEFPYLDEVGLAALDEVADDVRVRGDSEITMFPTTEGWRVIIESLLRGARAAGRAGAQAFNYVRSLLTQWYGEAEALGLIEAAAVVGFVVLAEIAFLAIWLHGANEGERQNMLTTYTSALVHSLNQTQYNWLPVDRRYAEAGIHDAQRLIQKHGTREAAQGVMRATYGGSESAQIQNMRNEMNSTGQAPSVLDRF